MKSTPELPGVDHVTVHPASVACSQGSGMPFCQAGGWGGGGANAGVKGLLAYPEAGCVQLSVSLNATLSGLTRSCQRRPAEGPGGSEGTATPSRFRKGGAVWLYSPHHSRAEQPGIYHFSMLPDTTSNDVRGEEKPPLLN